MGEEIAFENGRLSRARDLDFGLWHTAYGHASLIDLYLHTKCRWNQRNFVDGRTGILRPTLLGRLGGVNLKIKEKTKTD